MNLAVIPARGGSKRIPRKNIKLFCGKPIIAWSIEAAKKSGCFDDIIVSTDDKEIADIAKSYGANVPFLRPSSLADDYTGTIPVIKHAIEWFVEHCSTPSKVCCIYATAPFLREADLKEGYTKIRNCKADYAFAVTKYPFPIQRAIKLDIEGHTEMFQPENFNVRSQDLIPAYHDAAQFYWGDTSAWLDEKSLFSALSLPIIIPHYRAQDIDTLDDWHRAELMFSALQRSIIG